MRFRSHPWERMGNYIYGSDADNLEHAINEALAVIKPGMTDLDKALALHDYLVLHIAYAYKDYIKWQPGRKCIQYIWCSAGRKSLCARGMRMHIIFFE